MNLLPINITTLICVIAYFSFSPIKIKAQYYYKDIWNTIQLNKQSIKLKNEGIKKISTNSFEDDGTPSREFFCEKKIDKDFKSSSMISNSYITGNSLIITYYNDAAQVVKVIDSSSSFVNYTEYKYTGSKINLVTTFTKSVDGTSGITESHQYIYNTNGQPEKMIRKKMDIEFSTVSFKWDKAGNVIEEDEVFKKTPGRKYYYYYNDKNQLTDVVHKSEKVNRLIPDYIYEYDNKGNISQLITIEEGSNNYFTWKYTNDERNFRISEKCYSKEKRLLGTITYSYKL